MSVLEGSLSLLSVVPVEVLFEVPVTGVVPEHVGISLVLLLRGTHGMESRKSLKSASFPFSKKIFPVHSKG